MIYVFYGKDEFGAHEALAALRRELDQDGFLDDNTTRVEGASAKPDELLLVCQTLPFLSARRLVVVEGLLGRFDTGGRPRRAGATRRRRGTDEALAKWEEFAAALKELPESTALVFLDGDVTAGNPILALLKPLAQVREFPALKQAELAAWINQRAAHHGINLQARAVATLAALVGTQLRLLDSELQKLATFAGGRQVTEEDVRSLVSLAREPNVFALADAVIEGRAREAADLLQRLLADGEAPQRLLTMLARQYRQLLLTKEMLERRVRGPEISARLGAPGFVVQRLLRQAPAHRMGGLRQAYHKLLDADLSVKRGIFDDETALQLLVVELASLARPARAGAGAGRS